VARAANQVIALGGASGESAPLAAA
jgi:hypothetical protein